MTGYQQQSHNQQYAGGAQVQLTGGLQKFMSGVYGWMAAGIGVTAAVAYGASQSAAALSLMFSPQGGFTMVGYLIVFSPLILAWVLPSRIPSMSPGGAVAAFMAFAGLLGLGLSYIPLIYSGTSIGMVMLATVGMFAGMASIGYITKKDLTGMGQFLVMALIGAIIASLVNFMFIGSLGMSTVISAIVAVVAAGLTAYHTQAIKQIYLMNGGRGNLAIIGALALYVDFINLFLSLLRLFGGARD